MTKPLRYQKQPRCPECAGFTSKDKACVRCGWTPLPSGHPVERAPLAPPETVEPDVNPLRKVIPARPGVMEPQFPVSPVSGMPYLPERDDLLVACEACGTVEKGIGNRPSGPLCRKCRE